MAWLRAPTRAKTVSMNSWASLLESNFIVRAVGSPVWVQCVHASKPVTNFVKQRAFGIKFGVCAENNGLVTAEVKLVEYVGADFLVEASQRCVHDKRWHEFGEATQGFIE